MRAPLIRLGCLLSLVIASSASAVTIEWTFIGDPGNAADADPTTDYCGFTHDQPCGAVDYTYSIGTYEVTNAQYAEFLNAKAAADPFGLYNPSMRLPTSARGGITRSGDPGAYSYTPIAGRENMSVNWVSFYDALRFTNWMNNGQGTGDTETGAYTLLGGTATPSNGSTVMRNAAATIVLTSEDEWYKAAYYDAVSASYFSYPAGSNAQTTCSVPTSAPNSANCSGTDGTWVGDVTNIGSYTGSASPYGTFDQGGNVWEWNDSLNNYCGRTDLGCRVIRGGSWAHNEPALDAASPGSSPSRESGDQGFRLAMIPEPGTGLLVTFGLLGLAGWRRARA